MAVALPIPPVIIEGAGAGASAASGVLIIAEVLARILERALEGEKTGDGATSCAEVTKDIFASLDQETVNGLICRHAIAVPRRARRFRQLKASTRN
jgi:hypothetical protein